MRAFDFETFPIGPQTVLPKPVCCSIVALQPNGEETLSYLVGNADEDWADLPTLLLDGSDIVIAHHAAFDISILLKYWPDHRPMIVQAIEDGRFRCTLLRERLFNLSTTGILTHINLESTNGSVKGKKLSYTLSQLAELHLGVNRQQEKNAQDSWRFHYQTLDNVPSLAYPPEAREYAIQDSMDALRIYLSQQEKRWDDIGPGSMFTEEFQVAASVALQLTSDTGMRVDAAYAKLLIEKIDHALTAERFEMLLKYGILRPAVLPRRHKNNPDKLTKGKPPSINTARLQAVVVEVANQHGIEVRRTPTGRVAVDAEVLEQLNGLDPIISNYADREKLIKLRSTYVSKLVEAAESGSRMRFNFETLVETGRTASYGGKLYPSMNGQNADPRIRPALMADEGHVLISTDYSALELVTLAQTLHSLGLESNLRKQLIAGIDPHAFLGARIALALSEPFRELCEDAKLYPTPIDPYDLFIALKSSEHKEERDFYNHFRTFAKPTGLGYPGGLGARTFCSYARGTYGIDVDIETAKLLKEVWLETYPEMRDYFRWIEQQSDPFNPECYSYTTPFGMYRAGATYCAACNGKALQSPAAEGAKLALWEVAKKTLIGPAPLLGAKLINFVHDQIIIQVPDNGPEFCTQAAADLELVMIDAMRVVTPDVPVKVETTAMYRWDKYAKPIWTPEGYLLPWEPVLQGAI